MSHVCSFIPDYYLQRIIDAGTAPAEVIDACQSTISKSRVLRNARIEHCQKHSSAPHTAIAAQAEDCADCLHKIGQTLTYYAAQGRKPGLNLKIYDAENEESFGTANLFHWEDKTDPSNDGNECYIGVNATYDFLLKFFSRNSLDGNGLPIVCFVHYDKDLDNAFWDGERLVFGDIGKVFNSLTDEVDVIAHEMGHGVVQYTVNLDFGLQPGALNEHLADVFGIMVKQWSEKPGYPKTVEESNWLIGEGVWRDASMGPALRNMKNPGTAFKDDDQPAHWKDFKKLPNTESGDFGGVHVNCGIPNRAFFLAATKIGGFAWEGAGQIWYKALTTRAPPQNATFKQFADATIANAGDHADKVKEAWEEVGYPFPTGRHEL